VVAPLAIAMFMLQQVVTPKTDGSSRRGNGAGEPWWWCQQLLPFSNYYRELASNRSKNAVAMATAAVEAALKSISDNTAVAAMLLKYIKKLAINQYSGNSGSAAACGDNDLLSVVVS